MYHRRIQTTEICTQPTMYHRRIQTTVICTQPTMYHRRIQTTEICTQPTMYHRGLRSVHNLQCIIEALGDPAASEALDFIFALSLNHLSFISRSFPWTISFALTRASFFGFEDGSFLMRSKMKFFLQAVPSSFSSNQSWWCLVFDPLCLPQHHTPYQSVYSRDR